jgi:hypothetical protein
MGFPTDAGGKIQLCSKGIVQQGKISIVQQGIALRPAWQLIVLRMGG